MGFSFDGVTSKSMGIASRMATENRVPELKNRTIPWRAGTASLTWARPFPSG